MAPSLEPVLNYLETLPGGADSADADLLRRFADAREEAAFAAILRRHGPMVLAACRRMLRDTHDAEDAFQAAFLVLARKAGSVRNAGSLAGWLHGVACRVAREARTRAARRRKHEGRVCPREETASAADPSDLRAVLDEELMRLPEKYRSPLVLHYLEGKTKEEAARDLGWTEGTVSGRLARARLLLRDRLTRRGLAPAAVLPQLLPVLVPAPLAAATLRAALVIGTRAAASGPAVTLAEVTLRGMTLARPGVRLTALLALAALSAGGLAAYLTGSGDAAESPPPAPAAPASPIADAVPRADQPGDPLPAGAVARIGAVRLRHAGTVTGLAFLPGGKLLASASRDHTARLWDLATGRELRCYTAMEQLANESFTLSADGRLLAAGSQGEVRVWDVATGELRHELDAGRSGTVWSVAFSADGRLLAAGTGASGTSGRVRLWEAASGRPVRTLDEPHKHDVRVAFAPDGKLLATSGDDGTIRLLNPATGAKQARIRGHFRPLQSLAFSPDGRALLSAGHDHTLRLWDVATGKEQSRLYEGKPPPPALDGGYLCSDAVFSPDGKLVAWASDTGDGGRIGMSIFLFDAQTGKEVRRINPGLSATFDALAFSADGQTLASGGADKTIRLWDVATGKERHPFPPVPRPGVPAVSPDGRVLAALDGRDLALFDAVTGRELRRWRAVENSENPWEITEMAYLPDGRHLVTAGWGPVVRVWATTTGKEVRRFRENEYVTEGLSPDGARLVTSEGRGQKSLQVWDVASGKKVRSFGTGAKVVFAPDGKTLAALEDDENGPRFWDASTGRPLPQLSLHGKDLDAIAVAAFSPDGKRLVTFGFGSRQAVRLWDLGTGETLWGRDGDGAFAFSPDGKILAVAGKDHAVHLLETAGGKERGAFRGHDGPIDSIAFLPGGKGLVSSSADGTILVWALPDAGAGP
jgi:RNA polymerase sigma factor (sigma-70 family)